MMYLRACPHCGNDVAPMLTNARDLGDSNACPDQHVVVCSMIEPGPGPIPGWHTGCGAAGGYAQAPEEAAAKWNQTACTLPNDELCQMHENIMQGLAACSKPNGAEDCNECPYAHIKGECLADGLFPQTKLLLGVYEALLAEKRTQLANANAPKTLSIAVGDGSVGFLFSSDAGATHPALLSIYDLGGPHPIGTPVPTDNPPVVQLRFSNEDSVGIMLKQAVRANNYLHDTALIARAKATAEADLRNEVRSDLMNKVRMALRATPVAPAAQEGPFDE